MSSKPLFQRAAFKVVNNRRMFHGVLRAAAKAQSPRLPVDTPTLQGSIALKGGRIADLLQGLNSGSDISMNVSIAGANFFQVGDQVLQYHVTPQGSIGLDGSTWNWSPWIETFAQNTQMLGRSYGHIFEQEYANIMKRGINNDALVKAALAANPLPANVGTFPNSLNAQGGLNRVASQLKMILRMIHARQSLGMKRQIFFAALGGFDTHDAQLDDHAALLLELSSAVADFYTHTGQLGIANKVTLFTASDFNRTYNSNGKGSDHAWGGHHLIVGGAVNGGRLYGEMPVLQIQGPDDTGTRGSWIPKVSTDEMAATLARWFGVPDGSLGAWKELTALPAPRSGAAAAIVGDALYLWGGRDAAGPTTVALRGVVASP